MHASEPKKSIARIILGVILIIIGILALVTPFSPGSWLVFVGLGMLGVHLAFWEKIKTKFFKKPPE